MAVRIAVISDTHFPARGRALPPACTLAIAGADLLIHAGDLADMNALSLMRSVGPPLVAVHGNADDAAIRKAVPATAQVELAGLRLAVVHNGGPEAGRLERISRRQPRHSMAEIVLDSGHPPEVRFLSVDDPAGPLPGDLIRR